MDIADISFEDLDRIAREAGSDAAERALLAGFPVTFGSGSLVIRVWPDGRREIVKDSNRARSGAARPQG